MTWSAGGRRANGRPDEQRRSCIGKAPSSRFVLLLGGITVCGATISCENNIAFGNLPGKPVCSVEDCGGDATTISGAVMIPALKNADAGAANVWLRAGHSLMVGVCRNGECPGDDTIRVNTDNICSDGNGTIYSCVSLKANGDACQLKTVQTDSASFLCLVVTTQGTRWPKVDGVEFSLSVRDDSGTTLVQASLVVHYEQVMPANCDNLQHVECTNGEMFF